MLRFVRMMHGTFYAISAEDLALLCFHYLIIIGIVMQSHDLCMQVYSQVSESVITL